MHQKGMEIYLEKRLWKKKLKNRDKKNLWRKRVLKKE